MNIEEVGGLRINQDTGNRVLIIKSSEWLRGDSIPDDTSSCLWDPNLKKGCCLGLDAIDRGIDKINLSRVTIPGDISFPDGYGRKEFSEYFDDWTMGRSDSYINNKLCDEAVSLNDDDKLTDEEIIEGLRQIFLRNCIEIDWRPNE